MFSDPVKNLKKMSLREEDVVADLGAGSGFYALAAGRMVPLGRVYAIEIQEDYATALRRKVAEARLQNVEVLRADVEKPGGTGLADGIVDAAVASGILFQVENRDAFAREVYRILKPGGQVLLVDWSDASELGRGFSVVPREAARKIFEESGFRFEREIDAGEHHYGMIFQKTGGA